MKQDNKHSGNVIPLVALSNGKVIRELARCIEESHRISVSQFATGEREYDRLHIANFRQTLEDNANKTLTGKAAANELLQRAKALALLDFYLRYWQKKCESPLNDQIINSKRS